MKTKGAKDKVPGSLKRVAANTVNARRRRPRLSPQAVQTVSQAKEELAKMVVGPGLQHIKLMIQRKHVPPPPDQPDDDDWKSQRRWRREVSMWRREVQDGFEWAMTFAADRGIMPRRTELDVDASSEQPLLLRVEGGLGWPGVDGGAVGGGDGGSGSAGRRG